MITEMPEAQFVPSMDRTTPPELGGRRVSDEGLDLLGGPLADHIAVEPVPEVPATRADRVFAALPELTEDEQGTEAQGFADLLNPDTPVVEDVEAGAVRPDAVTERAQVTEQSLQDADQMLQLAVKADPELRRILIDGTPGVKTQPELAHALRTNQQLRTAVGEHILQRIDGMLNVMPNRIFRNTEKTSAHKGYTAELKLTSREYAALLALSMLDGTFKESQTSKATDTYDPQTDKGNGQHRYAARMALTAH